MTSAPPPRYAVGQMPVSGDWVVDRLEGPRKIAIRGGDGEVIRYASRADAETALNQIRIDAMVTCSRKT